MSQIENFWNQLFINLPESIAKLITAFIILTSSMILAKIIQNISKNKKIQIEKKHFKDNPLFFAFNYKSLEHLPIIVGQLLSWFLIIISFVAISDVFGLNSISRFLLESISFLPRLFSAVLIFFAGVLLAGWLESVIKNLIVNNKPRFARLTSKIASYAILVIFFLISLSELGIASDFILILFTGLIFALALGGGLAIGLGGQDLVRQILKDWIEHHK